MATIDLDERPGRYVHLSILNATEEYALAYSMILSFNPAGNTLHARLKEIIQSKYALTTAEWNGVEFLALAVLEIHDTTNLPDPVIGLQRLSDDGSPSNCLVATVDEQLNFLHRPKRTSGKVSNKLGD